MQFATIKPHGNQFAVMMHRGSEASCVEQTTAPDRAEVRECWLQTTLGKTTPLIYGIRILDTDDQDRRTRATGWARWRGRIYKVSLRWWYAKEGDGFTVNAFVSRAVDGGRASASMSLRDTHYGEAVTQLLSRVARLRKPTHPVTGKSGGGAPRPERSYKKEDWSL